MPNSPHKSRVNFRTDRFVQHSVANQIIDEMQLIYDLSGQNRRPVNLAIVGEGGTGKTSIMEHFLTTHVATQPKYSKFGFKKNISFLDLPPRVTPKKLLHGILNPHQANSRAMSMGAFSANAEEIGLKLIIIDEFSELDRTHKNYRQEVLHTMKWIGNNLKIPFIVAGTNCITRVFTDDPQMGRRFKLIRLKQWTPGREFEYFVYSYLKSLPGFDGIETLSKDLFSVLMHGKSRTTFDVVTTLGDAAYQAYMNQDVDNVHVYARQIAMRSGDENQN